MTEWQPIDTAPKDGEWLLVYGFWYPKGDYSGITLGAYLPDEEMWTFEGDLMDRPTHWMPLPAPPVNTSTERVNEIGES